MNRKKTIHGIDLTAPGGLERLLAHHRATFGDAMMMADGDGGDGSTPPAGDGTPPPAGDQTPPAATPPAGETPPAGGTEWDGKVESLPADVQKIIKDLRTEAAGNRTGKTAAEQQLAAIQKALNPDAGNNEKPDPAKLTEQLTQQQAEARQARTELSVYKLAGKQQADADALLDSRGFLAKIADIDPADEKALTKAITDAVTANPKLKAVQAAGQSGADFTGRTGENGNKKPVPLDQAVSTHYGS